MTLSASSPPLPAVRLLKSRACRAAIAGLAIWSSPLSAAPRTTMPTVDGGSEIFCKDCTFPVRIASNRWLMPNGQLEVEISEKSYDADRVAVLVLLRDAKTEQLLASGQVLRPRTRKGFYVPLKDRGGDAVMGQIHWVSNPNVVQVRFSCVNRCSISEFFE